MITLELNKTQAAFLEAALERAMDNEGHDDYLQAYEELLNLLEKAKENA